MKLLATMILMMCCFFCAFGYEDLGPLKKAQKKYPNIFVVGSVHKIVINSVDCYVFSGSAEQFFTGAQAEFDSELYEEATLSAKAAFFKHLIGKDISSQVEMSGCQVLYRFNDKKTYSIILFVPENNVVIKPSFNKEQQTKNVILDEKENEFAVQQNVDSVQESKNENSNNLPQTNDMNEEQKTNVDFLAPQVATIEQPQQAEKQPVTTIEQPQQAEKQPETTVEQPQQAEKQPVTTVEQSQQAEKQPITTVEQSQQAEKQPVTTVEQSQQAEQLKNVNDSENKTLSSTERRILKYRKRLEKFPDDIISYVLLGEIQRENGNYEEAINCFLNAIRLFEHNDSLDQNEKDQLICAVAGLCEMQELYGTALKCYRMLHKRQCSEEYKRKAAAGITRIRQKLYIDVSIIDRFKNPDK